MCVIVRFLRHSLRRCLDRLVSSNGQRLANALPQGSSLVLILSVGLVNYLRSEFPLAATYCAESFQL